MTSEAIAWTAAVVAGLGLAWLVYLVTRNWGRWRFLPGCLVLAWSLTPFRFDGEHEAPAFAVVVFRAFLEDGLDPGLPLVALAAVSSGVVVIYLAVIGVLAWVAPRRAPDSRGGASLTLCSRVRPGPATPTAHENKRHGRRLPYSRLFHIDAGQCRPSTKMAMRFTALTAARQVEVRRATCDQFDLEAAVWVKPVDNTKTAKSHRVPLSRQALAVPAEARGCLGSSPAAVRGRCWATR